MTLHPDVFKGISAMLAIALIIVTVVLLKTNRVMREATDTLQLCVTDRDAQREYAEMKLKEAREKEVEARSECVDLMKRCTAANDACIANWVREMQKNKK